MGPRWEPHARPCRLRRGLAVPGAQTRSRSDCQRRWHLRPVPFPSSPPAPPEPGGKDSGALPHDELVGGHTRGLARLGAVSRRPLSSSAGDAGEKTLMRDVSVYANHKIRERL